MNKVVGDLVKFKINLYTVMIPKYNIAYNTQLMIKFLVAFL